MARQATWKVPGEFVPCDVNLANDPAIMRAGPWAELLFRRANEHIKRNGRDGTLDRVELRVVALGIPGKPEAHATALVRECLWEETEDGWSVRSFLKWNPSRAVQATQREQKQAGAAITNHNLGRHVSPDARCPLCREGSVTP